MNGLSFIELPDRLSSSSSFASVVPGALDARVDGDTFGTLPELAFFSSAGFGAAAGAAAGADARLLLEGVADESPSAIGP